MVSERSQWPKARVGEVIGLLEMIDDEKGKIDIYKLGKTIGHKLEQLLDVIETAKLFSLVRVEEGDVFYTELGKTLIMSPLDDRKKIITDLLIKINVYKELLNVLYLSENHTIDISYLEEIISHNLSEKEIDRLRDIILDWGRFAEIIWFDSDDQQIHLNEPEEEDQMEEE
jgi:NitT/TauT family transport system ATP-binding protein